MSSSWEASWRVAPRLARREIRRSAAHSALVAAIVGVPILLITGALVLVRTVGKVGSDERALRLIGAADVRIEPEGRARVVQDLAGNSHPAGSRLPDAPAVPWSAGDVEADVGDVLRTGQHVQALLGLLVLVVPSWPCSVPACSPVPACPC